MRVTLELWQVISLSLTLAIALMGAFAGLVRLLLRQVEQRIEQRLELLSAESRGWRDVEKELNSLRVDLPERYVRREDYIRGQTVIEAKLDAIRSEVEVVKIQGARNG